MDLTWGEEPPIPIEGKGSRKKFKKGITKKKATKVTKEVKQEEEPIWQNKLSQKEILKPRRMGHS